MDLEKYKTLFVDETTEYLATMGRAIAQLDDEPSDESLAACTDTLFRMAHSIKGMAASMEYDTIAQLARRIYLSDELFFDTIT